MWLATWTASGLAQVRPLATDAVIAEAERSVLGLLEIDVVRSPDEPSWAAALASVDALVAERDPSAAVGGVTGPGWPEALRLQADAYAWVGWWSRSLTAWDRLRAVDGAWTEWDASRWAEVVARAGFARYDAGDLEGATGYFVALAEARPDEVEAWRWLARIALESDGANAVELWQRVVDLSPSDDGAAYHLALARERTTHGRTASDAFREGLVLHGEGDLTGAAVAFARAAEAAPTWTDAARWWARTLLEDGRAAEAVPVWQRAADLDPGDAGLAWWLERARLEARVGQVAAAAADEARRLSAEGSDAEAAEAWSEALLAAPEWLEAQLGRARALLAAGDAERALDAWVEILDLVENDATLRAEAKASIDLATLFAALEPEAAAAVAAALRDYENGDAAQARVALVEVVTQWPDATLAWSWLGNVSFAERDYVTAATAYATASLLDPTDEDLAFFASEARRLAEAASGSDGP